MGINKEHKEQIEDNGVDEFQLAGGKREDVAG